MKSKKLLTIALTSLLVGSCLTIPALADSATAQSGGNVSTYEISANVKRIDEYAFANSTNLVSVKIPDSVTAIGDYAFSGCTSLKEITIPSSVTKIGVHAFDGCTALVKVAGWRM